MAFIFKEQSKVLYLMLTLCMEKDWTELSDGLFASESGDVS